MMKMKGVENKAMAPKGQTKSGGGKPAPAPKGGKKGKGC